MATVGDLPKEGTEELKLDHKFKLIPTGAPKVRFAQGLQNP